MTYHTFMAKIDRTSRVKISEAIDLLEKMLLDANQQETDAIDDYCKIYDIVDILFEKDIFEGNASDFHNIAVVFARNDEYEIACNFLDRGLREFPHDMDLLADYLNYGMECSRKEECSNAYSKLITLPNWNWRAYQFAIEYLISLSSIDGKERDREIWMKIREYKEKLPEKEEAYLLEADFFHKRGKVNPSADKQSFVDILNYVTSDNSFIKCTPKCDLRLADFYFESGTNNDRTIELLERCLHNSVEIQKSISRNYVYLLLSLCYIRKWYLSTKNEDDELEKEVFVKSAYKYYHIAITTQRDSRVLNCKDMIEAVIQESGIAYPYDDGVQNDY